VERFVGILEAIGVGVARPAAEAIHGTFDGDPDQLAEPEAVAHDSPLSQ
jgi:hypothetical protein